MTEMVKRVNRLTQKVIRVLNRSLNMYTPVIE